MNAAELSPPVETEEVKVEETASRSHNGTKVKDAPRSQEEVKAAPRGSQEETAKVKATPVGSQEDVKVKATPVGSQEEVKVKATPVGSQEEVKVKAAASGTLEVRHQLQKMVSGKLETRGVNIKELWTGHGAGNTLTKEEQERLERQRLNKRKWARKDRAKCKALMNDLRQNNGVLEFQNKQLKGEVDKLRQKTLDLRNALSSHQCRLRDGTKVFYLPVNWSNNSKETDIGVDMTKHFILQDNPGQVWRPSLSHDAKKDISGHRSSHGLVPVTRGVLGVADQYPVGHSRISFPHAPKLNISHLRPRFPIGTNLTVRSRIGAELRKITPQPEKPNEKLVVKLQTGDVTGISGPQFSNTPGVNESKQLLSSGGFTVSDLTYSRKSLQYTLREGDDDDVEMTEGPSAALKRRKKHDQDNGQHNEDSGYPSEIKTSRITTAREGSKTEGLQSALLVPITSFTRNWVKPEPVLDKRHQSSDTALAVSATSKAYVNSTSKEEPSSSGTHHNLDKREALKVKQEASTSRVSDSPRKSDILKPEAAKHMTQKGVLMKRWFAQDDTKEPTKKHAKSESLHRTKKDTSVHVFINPWAVVNPSETGGKPVFGSSDSPDSLGPHQFEATTSSALVRSADKDVSELHEAPLTVVSRAVKRESVTGPQVWTTSDPDASSKLFALKAIDVVSATDIEEIHPAVAHSQVLATPDSDSSSSSQMFAHTPEAEELSIPYLTQEGQTLTRRLSWSGEEIRTRPASRPRCSSLPSSFADVMFTADDGTHMFLTPELIEAVLDNSEDVAQGYLPMFIAVNSDPHTITKDSISSETSSANETGTSASLPMFAGHSDLHTTKGNVLSNVSSANETVFMTASNFSLRNVPSTPLTPSSPLLNRAAATTTREAIAAATATEATAAAAAAAAAATAAVAVGSKGKGGSGRLGKAPKSKGGCEGSREWEVINREGEAWGEMESSRVKVERVPDADIPTWQVLYEVPFVSEQSMDTASWRPESTP